MEVIEILTEKLILTFFLIYVFCLYKTIVIDFDCF